MMRLLVTGAVMALLAACSLNPFRAGQDAKVIAESRYCGTPSQDSDLHYFSDKAAFEDWIEYRSIREFEPAMASHGGVVVAEMGQRPTGGYHIKLDRDKTEIQGDTLVIGMSWRAPRMDAAISQALIAPCTVIKPPKGNYTTVRLVDQLGNERGRAKVR